MNAHTSTSLANLTLSPVLPRVLLGILRDREHEGLTELIARLALRGPFHLIAGSEWLPDQDSLRRSVRRYTTAVYETLDHPILGRPSTCLQLLDQLTSASSQNHPILILDFLHYFYDPDVDISLRERVLGQCIRGLKHLSQTKPVVVLVEHLQTEEYQHFFPMLATIADEILEAKQAPASLVSQPTLFGEE